MDWTSPQMMLTIKLIQFGWNLKDASLLSPSKTEPSNASKASNAQVVEYWKSNAIENVPGPLEFFGWIFFFPSFLTGPAFEFNVYKSFIDGKMFEKEKNHEKPSSFIPALQQLAYALVCALFVVISSKFPVRAMLLPEFATQSLLRKWIYLTISVCLVRFKYYFAWKLSEASCCLIGITYIRRGDRVEW
jgi:lysophospholipid acyltransferase